MIEGNDVIVELNDVSSGSMIIAFQLWAEFSPDRNDESLIPLTLDYCRRDTRRGFETEIINFNSHAWGRATRHPRDFKFVFGMFLVDQSL